MSIAIRIAGVGHLIVGFLVFQKFCERLIDHFFIGSLTDNPQLPEMAAVFFNKVLAIYRLQSNNIQLRFDYIKREDNAQK